MRKITRWDTLCVGLLLGICLFCLVGCNTIRGVGLDLAGAAEGSAKQIDAPNRMEVANK